MILLRIPVTKKVVAGTKPMNAQKGDTCWYYAARLVREYHGMTYSWIPEASLTESTRPARQIERSISAVRKFETDLGVYMDTQVKLWAKKPDPGQVDALYDLLRRSGAQNLPAKSDLVEFINENYEEVTNFAEAHQALYDYLKTWNSYASIGASTVTGIWAKYGFLFQDASDLTAIGLAILIGQYGPLTVAGTFLDADGAIASDQTVSFAGKVNVARVTDFSTGDHAIAVCGVAYDCDDEATPLVFYHDPNEPTILAATSFTKFKGRLNAKVGLGYLPCGSKPCAHRVDIALM
jgi:hypothetical protein